MTYAQYDVLLIEIFATLAAVGFIMLLVKMGLMLVEDIKEFRSKK